ncbi:zf-HC2 domain-containing protein [Planosporangium flavigriseum]|nr:zf-HC2 domain-containing protein [Planosporangium flavigriseum]NJC67233.1 zf-HC2 domain-containing protein [Planosporangium flavigriseum]
MTAHSALSCDQARLALSARLDGEPLGVSADRLGLHIDTCRACSDWLARAEQVTRLVRLQPARVPDLTDAILAAVAADSVAADSVAADSLAADRARPAAGAQARAGRAGAGRQALTRLLQAAIAAVASMQLLVIISVVLGISVDEHADHEAGAFAAAVAAGFLLAAFRPRLARAYTPIAIVLAVCLTVTSRMGMSGHEVTMLREIGGYVATIVQAVLIFTLGRLYSPSDASSNSSPNSSPNSSSGRGVVNPTGIPA